MSAAHDPSNASITELFADLVRRQPAATALRFGQQEMTYAELDQAADRLARRLRARGVGLETVVGVCMDRSLEMFIALVGILKANGAYLPMRPSDPTERLRYMLEQAGATLVLADPARSDQLATAGADVLSVRPGTADHLADDGPVPSLATADNLAYVCYTSGSTGEPKGVSVPHRGVVRLVRDTDYAVLGPEHTFLQLCSLTFDPATFEIWGALLNGGRLVIYPPGPLSLADLGACIEREKITTLWLTTGLFHRMVDTELASLGHLQQLLAGGDVLSPAHINRVRQTHPHVRIVNGYGPTENTTFTTCHTVTALVTGRVPIGTAIAGTRAYVLDDDLQPVTDGSWGKLFTSGSGLARGYIGRPDYTAEKFLPDPFHPGERMYATGDIVRLGPGGALEFGGRGDSQVKVGGYRVEPGEIEATLAGHPRVKEVVVIPRQDVSEGEKVLVAYVTAEGDEDGMLPALRVALHQRLPRHMIPRVIVVLDEFPLTGNGKLDRAALPRPAQAERDVDAYYAEPRTRTEALLADLWADALDVTKVGIHDNFFELGGNSLMAADLLGRIREALSANVPGARLFFENATVAGLAELVGDGDGFAQLAGGQNRAVLAEEGR